ncbi:MAG: hypothetical protein IJA12_01755 [Oscillospiraceae bacterium]|nr:hypothetical protein [Oscillospiraceae bacterium]
MKDDLLKLKSDNGDYIEDVWWKYNWSAEYELSDEMIHILTLALDSFIDKVYFEYENLNEKELLHCFREEVKILEKICSWLERDAFYDYGGLNDYFISIVSCFDFFVREKYMNDVESVYDCINGKPFKK